jgi:hypothetical protein
MRPALQLTRRESLAILVGGNLIAPVRADPLRITLATATPGGGFPAYGAAFAAAIRRADPDLVIVPEASGGSAENLQKLSRGAVDLALVQGAYAYPVLGPAGGPKVLAPMYSTPGLFVVRADSPVHRVADLKGQAVILGTRNSGLTVMGRAVLAASGLDPDHDIHPVLLDHAGDGPAMILAGKAAALWGGGIGWPGFMAVARAGGARFIGPSDQAITRLTGADPSLSSMTVPANAFPGQVDPIRTIGSWSFILAKPGFPAETAYRIVGALARAIPDLRMSHPQGAESDPRRLKGLIPSAWLNPGTARFIDAG